MASQSSSPETARQRVAYDADQFRHSAALPDMMPSPHLVISQAALESLAEQHVIIKIDKADISSNAESNPIFEQKDASGNALPIYVIVGKDCHPPMLPNASLMHTKEGDSYIVVNERAHKWTPSYIRENLMGSDELFDTAPFSTPEDFIKKLREQNNNISETTNSDTLQKGLQTAKDREAREMGLNNAQIRLLAPTESVAIAGAGVSIEGTNFIVIDEHEWRKALSSKETAKPYESIIGHELAHAESKDNDPKALSNLHNIKDAPSEIRAWQRIEMLADVKGAGPLGSNDPQSFADYITQRLKDGLSQGISEGDVPPNTSLKQMSDLDARQDPLHPATLDRIHILNQESFLIKEYEAANAVTSHDDRVKESDFLLRRLLGSAADKENMSAPPLPVKGEMPGVAESLTQEQLTHIVIIKNKLGTITPQHTDAPAAPLSPTSSPSPGHDEPKR